jgi:hypothetical protein
MFLVFVTWKNYVALNKLSPTLINTSSYPAVIQAYRSAIVPSNSDQKNQFLRGLQEKDSLFGVVEMNKTAEQQVSETQNYFNTIQFPYDSLLDYYLMPPLNIWKNRFNGQIDTDLI